MYSLDAGVESRSPTVVHVALGHQVKEEVKEKMGLPKTIFERKRECIVGRERERR